MKTTIYVPISPSYGATLSVFDRLNEEVFISKGIYYLDMVKNGQELVNAGKVSPYYLTNCADYQQVLNRMLSRLRIYTELDEQQPLIFHLPTHTCRMRKHLVQLIKSQFRQRVKVSGIELYFPWEFFVETLPGYDPGTFPRIEPIRRRYYTLYEHGTSPLKLLNDGFDVVHKIDAMYAYQSLSEMF